MRIYDPLNGLAFLLQAPRVTAAAVYAFCIHPHDVSLWAIAKQNSLKQMNRSTTNTFFFTCRPKRKLWPWHQGFLGTRPKEDMQQKTSLLNNQLNCSGLLVCYDVASSFCSAWVFVAAHVHICSASLFQFHFCPVRIYLSLVWGVAMETTTTQVNSWQQL